MACRRALRTRPRRGPGSGKRFPTWAAPGGPLIVSRPSLSNGHARNPAEQNHRRRPRPNPSAHSFSSLPLPHRSERATELVGRRATQREERKRARGTVLSPSLACAPTVGWTRHHRVASQRRLFTPALTDEVVSAVNLGGLDPEHTPVSGGRGDLLPPRRRRFEQR
jgi:hypothetical protein